MVTNSRTPLRADRLRPLNAPRPVSVELNEARLPKTLRDGNALKEIEALGEIWRVDDEWWREPISRRYVEVMLKGGGHVVLYEDLTTRRWFVQSP